jgi:hypothetical protein
VGIGALSLGVKWLLPRLRMSGAAPSTPPYIFMAWYLVKHSNLLTPWCRTLFEKLIVTQLVKKYPAFFMELEVSLPCSQMAAQSEAL